MLTELKLAPVVLPDTSQLPAFLRPLVEAAGAGDTNIGPVVTSVVEGFGFTDLTYGATAETDHRVTGDLRAFVYTTKPSAWVRRYDQRAYIEVDPRAQDTWDSPLPLIWDQTTFVDRDERTRAFLADALDHGIGSGVALSFHFGYNRHVMFALNSPEPVLSDVKRKFIDRSLGDIYLFGTTFHAIFLKGVVDAGVAPTHQGAPLSPREAECLGYVAKGLTDQDMARTMCITQATVSQHISNIRSKLGAANRAEAVALGLKAGFIRL